MSSHSLTAPSPAAPPGEEARRNVRGGPLLSQCDAAVIGSGLSGLTVGALLAQSGLRVQVLESHTRPGGYLSGFRRGDFLFDSSIQWLNHSKPGGFVNRILTHVGDDPPFGHTLNRIWRFKSDSADYLLTTRPDALRDRLAAEFPSDADGIRALFANARRLGDNMDVLGRRLRGPDTMRPHERWAFGLRMLAWAWPIRQMLRDSAERGLRRYAPGGGLDRLYPVEENFMSVAVPLAWAYNQDYETPPEGGCDTLVNWLCDRIRAAGSEVALARHVTRVTTDRRGAANGVLLDDGAEVRSRWVVPACDVSLLYGSLLPPTRATRQFHRRLIEAETAYSAFTIFVGLDCDARELGFDEEMLRVVLPGVARRELSRGNPATTMISALAPSVRDPSLAPPGKGTLAIHCPAYMGYETNWRTGKDMERGPAYRALKESFAATIMERLEREAVPGLRRHAEVVEAATPVTYWRYTGNRDGCILGFRPTRRNIRAGVARHRSPVANLYVAGQWSEYGGGIPIAVKAAANAALLVLRESNPDAARALQAVMDDRA